MRHENNYVPGDFLAVCEVCGFTWYASQMRRGIAGRQKGLVVCPDDFDEIHPHDLKRPVFKEDRTAIIK